MKGKRKKNKLEGLLSKLHEAEVMNGKKDLIGITPEINILENTGEVEIIEPPISQEKESRDQPFYSGVFSSLDKSASIFSRS